MNVYYMIQKKKESIIYYNFVGLYSFSTAPKAVKIA